jgi:flagellar protein FliO/FliZ
MFEYFLRLSILIPMVGGLAWGSLWLWRRLQLGLPIQPSQERPARLVDVVPMGTGAKLAVVHFDGRDLLVSVSRGQIALVSESRGDYIDG